MNRYKNCTLVYLSIHSNVDVRVAKLTTSSSFLSTFFVCMYKLQCENESCVSRFNQISFLLPPQRMIAVKSNVFLANRVCVYVYIAPKKTLIRSTKLCRRHWSIIIYIMAIIIANNGFKRHKLMFNCTNRSVLVLSISCLPLIPEQLGNWFIGNDCCFERTK